MKKTTSYGKPMQEHIFGEQFTLEALSANGNPLEQVPVPVYFEMCPPTLVTALLTENGKSAAGRKPIMSFSCSKSYFYNVIMAWATTR